MIKTLSKARKQERVKFLIPRSVQDCIPIRRIWADGIFQVGHQFSKTWSFTDINYSIAGKDDKTAALKKSRKMCKRSVSVSSVATEESCARCVTRSVPTRAK